jgi:uncharacterized membrane protein YeaQ/YmgE (transglycosylase-associated protein family)
MELFYLIVLGFASGWLASRVMKARGFAVLASLGVGVVGAIAGNSLLAYLNLPAYGRVGAFVTSFTAALILLRILRGGR